MLNSFWWGLNLDESKHINWLQWNTLCKPKRESGMVFKNFREFNLAMLGKQGWKLINKPESLIEKLLKSNYYKSEELLSARLGYKLSFIWCGI